MHKLVRRSLEKFDKCLHRAAQARSALKSRHSLSQAPEKGPEKSLSTVTSSQAPAQGPGLIVSLPSDSDLASANTITRLVEQDNNRELDSDLVLQAPCNNVTPAHLTNPPRKSASPEGSFYSNRSVSPMETVTVHTRPVPRQYAIQRSNRSPSDSNQRSKRHRHRSRSLSLMKDLRLLEEDQDMTSGRIANLDISLGLLVLGLVIQGILGTIGLDLGHLGLGQGHLD